MLRLFSILVGFTVMASQASILQDAASSAGDQYIKIEVRGRLKRAKPTTPAQSSAPLIVSNNLEFPLNFGKSPVPAKDLDAMYGKTVIVKGTLENHPDSSGRAHLVCMVTGKLKVAEDAAQAEVPEFLVGYNEGRHDSAAKLIEELGLKIVEHYKPGKYLRIQQVSKTKSDFLAKLRGSDAVRYVEANNNAFKIPTGEDVPSPPRLP